MMSATFRPRVRRPLAACMGLQVIGRNRSRWVHPVTHRIVKFLPDNPPERGDVVLVDGERCRVLRCPVRWDHRTWTMSRGVKVRPASLTRARTS